MKATIGVYRDQTTALEAVRLLKAAGYPPNRISILSHAKEEGESEEGEGIDSDNAFSRPVKVAATSLGIGAVVGPILGALTGIGVLAIPGLGILVGAGAIAGAVTGLEAGLIGGGIISALAIARMNKHHEDIYHEHLQQGRYLVIAHGDHDQLEHARQVLHDYNEHVQLDVHV